VFNLFVFCRMEELCVSEDAYVRASPTKCFLGGIAQHTVEVMSLCEFAKYDGEEYLLLLDPCVLYYIASRSHE
jgi:hypothetical protein